MIWSFFHLVNFPTALFCPQLYSHCIYMRCINLLLVKSESSVFFVRICILTGRGCWLSHSELAVILRLDVENLLLLSLQPLWNLCLRTNELPQPLIVWVTHSSKGELLFSHGHCALLVSTACKVRVSKDVFRHELWKILDTIESVLSAEFVFHTSAKQQEILCSQRSAEIPCLCL